MGESVASFYLPVKMIKSITWGNNEKRFMVISLSGAAYYYTIGDTKRPLTFEVPKFFPTSSVFTSDDFVILASNNGKVAKFNVHSRLIKVYSAHSSCINDIAYCKQLNLVLTASNDKTIKIFDTNLKFWKSFTHHKAMVTNLATNSVNSLCISGDLYGNVYVWDISEPLRFKIHKQIGIGSKNGIESLAFDRTGTIFAVATTDGHVSVWTVEMELLQAFKCSSNKLRFSPRLPMVLSSNNDSSPCVYSIEAAAKLLSLEGHDSCPVACDWSPSGKLIATADADGQIIVWKTNLDNFEVHWMEPELSEYHSQQIKLRAAGNTANKGQRRQPKSNY